MPQFYPNGIGGSLGDTLVTLKPLQTSGNVWYVHITTGVDAPSPAGRQREKPLATLAQAHTNAAAGDIIVCLDGHQEILVAPQALNKAGITIVGEGSSGGRPTVAFRINSAAANLFNVSVAGVKLRNLLFPPNLQSNVGARIILSSVNSSAFEMQGCYMQCGNTDVVAGLSITTGANGMRLQRCTFVSVATGFGSSVAPAVELVNAVTDMDIFDSVFDGGAVGFNDSIALSLSAAAVTRLRMEGCSFVRGADYSVNAGTTGYINPQVATGGVRGVW